MTAKDVKKQLDSPRIEVSKRKGIFTARQGFYYRFPKQHETFLAKVRALPGFAEVNRGTKFAPFRGGDTVAQGSHWWVKFKIEEGTE